MQRPVPLTFATLVPVPENRSAVVAVQQVARAVYYNRYQPQLQGALYFHATYIRPEWAKEKRRIARIGRHVFYR